MISLDWHHSNNVRFPHSVKNMQKIRIFLCLHVSSIVSSQPRHLWLADDSTKMHTSQTEEEKNLSFIFMD